MKKVKIYVGKYPEDSKAIPYDMGYMLELYSGKICSPDMKDFKLKKRAFRLEDKWMLKKRNG